MLAGVLSSPFLNTQYTRRGATAFDVCFPLHIVAAFIVPPLGLWFYDKEMISPFKFQVSCAFSRSGFLRSLTASARAPPAPAVGAGGRGTGRRAARGGGERPEARGEHFPRPGSGGRRGGRSAPVDRRQGVQRQGVWDRLAGAAAGPAQPAGAAIFQDRSGTSGKSDPGRPARAGRRPAARRPERPAGLCFGFFPSWPPQPHPLPTTPPPSPYPTPPARPPLFPPGPRSTGSVTRPA